MTQHTGRLRLPQILGYGLGDLGFNLFFTGLNLYLLFYYTDVLGLAPAIAGLIFMLPLFWDGVFDPVMGWIASRTRTRFGRYRPYLLLATPLMCVSFVLMFAAPLWFPGAVVMASAISHALFRTCFAIVNVPYSSMMASMTQDSQERSKLAGARMLCAIFGGLLAAAMTLELAKSFGGGDLKTGFVTVAALYAGACFVLLMVTFLTSSERGADGRLIEEPVISTADTFRFLKANKALWILFAGVTLGSLGHAIANGAIVYYVTYYAGLKDAISGIFTATLIAAALSIPFWVTSMRWLSKRQVWIIASLGSMLIMAALYLIAPRDFMTILILQSAAGFLFGAFAVTFWSMLPDTVEYGEWKSGVRDESIGFGINMLAQKAGSGIGVGLLGLILGAIGYVENQAQTPATLEGIRAVAFLPPMIMQALALAVIWFYPIDSAFHRRLVDDIRAKTLSAAPS